jgi:hypothetical protein
LPRRQPVDRAERLAVGFGGEYVAVGGRRGVRTQLRQVAQHRAAPPQRRARPVHHGAPEVGDEVLLAIDLRARPQQAC